MKNDQIILIPVPALFSFDECLWFLNRNYDDCLHIIHGDSITKAIEFEGNIFLIRIIQNGSFLEIDILIGEITPESKTFITNYVVEWFDMDRNIQPFYDLLRQDGRLAYMTELYKGLRLIGIADLFEAICWCIIGQQINLSFAYKVKRRLVEDYGRKVIYGDESYYIFPTCKIIAAIDPDDFKDMQFSKQKSQYIVGVAQAFCDGILDREKIKVLPDFSSKKKALISQKGIGEWTANYALMKSLKEPHCIPHGDIGLLNALSNHNIISQRSELDKIAALFNSFAGWESYLVFYLWRSLTVRI